MCYGEWHDLISYPNNQIKLDVANKSENNGKRRTIRISTKNRFNGGLFVIDVQHIPVGTNPNGNGVWPAIWLTGENWPHDGEIDIIEGVNNQNKNSSTLHTRDGCWQKNVPGISSGGDCAAGPNRDSTTGCGVSSPDNTFGPAFNNKGGGIFVCEWVYNGTIKIWFFTRDEFSKVNQLTPSSWKKPYALFNPCPNYFNNLKIIINTTLCGGWAGAVYPGGKTKCEKDIANANLTDAYWLINYIRVYQKK